MMRVIDASLIPARRMAAETAAIAEQHRSGRSPDTLRVHVVHPSVVLGRNRPLSDVNLRECRNSNVAVARAVVDHPSFHLGSGILAWDLIAERRRFGATPAVALWSVCEIIAAGISRLGLPARQRSPGTIEIAGGRICFAGGAVEGPTLVCEGILISACDIREVAATLTRAPDRITSLATFLGRTPLRQEVTGVMMPAFADALRADMVPGTLTSEERSLADRLFAAGYGTDRFVVGEGTRRTRALSPRRHRTP